jgi:hypothetical protein
MKKNVFFILLMSISCHASIFRMDSWVRDKIIEERMVRKECQRLTNELMNSLEFAILSRHDLIRRTQETSKFLAFARRLIIDRRKELVKLQLVPLEEWEFQKKQMRREDLKNRMREVRLHMAEKRRKKK